MPSVIVDFSFSEARFECQRCGQCCHHKRPLEFGDLVPAEAIQEFVRLSNLIYLTPEDIVRISERFGLEPHEFVDTLYPYDGNPVKVEDGGRTVVLDLPVLRSKEDTTCVFYDNGCTIYPVRPAACRLFPFLVEEKENQKGDLVLTIGFNPSCPGIGKGARAVKRKLERLVVDQFLKRTESVAPIVQRLYLEGRISRDAKVKRTHPGRRRYSYKLPEDDTDDPSKRT